MTLDRTEAFAQQLADAGADAPFMREDLLFWEVPAWIVRAYAAARFARADVTQALAVACLGENDAAICRGNPKLVIWTLVRAWTGRLGELERKARGLTTEKAA